MKCGEDQAMRTVIVRALLFTAVAVLTVNPVLTPVIAANSDSLPPPPAPSPDRPRLALFRSASANP